MRVAIGADHAGLPLKGPLVEMLRAQGHEVDDLGAHALDPDDDFPDLTRPVAEAVAAARADRGVVVCGSGVGASVAANKFVGVRAAVCHDTYSAHQGVEHDDMNVLCLGARIVGEELAKELVSVFIDAEFIEAPKYRRRLDKLLDIEASQGLR